MKAFPHFLRKLFLLRNAKICKRKKNALFKPSEHSFFSSRYLENHFLRSFLWPHFDLNSFELFVLLSQKMVSTLSLKNLKKSEKCSFQTLRTFVFELRIALKIFSKKLPMTKFLFKYFSALCLIFTQNVFYFATQKFEKKWKLPFSNLWNIRFSAQGSLKTIFLEVPYH